jgi:Cdc6-like AAA superfamily ATPase
MNNKFQIINIEGAEGVGKTAQVNLLRNYLKDKVKLSVRTLQYTTPKALELMENTTKFLEENPEGLQINDGSIVRMIVKDISTGLSKDEVTNKNSDIIHAFEVLNHRFSNLNILLLPQNIEMCQDRITKRQKLLRLKEKQIDFVEESAIVKGLYNFSDHMLSLNVKLKVIIVEEKDTMLSIHKKILEILEER